MKRAGRLRQRKRVCYRIGGKIEGWNKSQVEIGRVGKIKGRSRSQVESRDPDSGIPHQAEQVLEHERKNLSGSWKSRVQIQVCQLCFDCRSYPLINESQLDRRISGPSPLVKDERTTGWWQARSYCHGQDGGGCRVVIAGTCKLLWVLPVWRFHSWSPFTSLISLA